MYVRLFALSMSETTRCVIHLPWADTVVTTLYIDYFTYLISLEQPSNVTRLPCRRHHSDDGDIELDVILINERINQIN